MYQNSSNHHGLNFNHQHNHNHFYVLNKNIFTFLYHALPLLLIWNSFSNCTIHILPFYVTISYSIKCIQTKDKPLANFSYKRCLLKITLQMSKWGWSFFVFQICDVFIFWYNLFSNQKLSPQHVTKVWKCVLLLRKKKWTIRKSFVIHIWMSS